MTDRPSHASPRAARDRRRGIAWPEQDSRSFLYAAVVLTMAGVVFADVYTPLGVAVWIIYLVPVILTLFLWRPTVPVAVATATTVFMLIGFMLSPHGANPIIARVNRGLAIGTVWIMAVIGHVFIRSKLAIRRQEWLQSGQTGLSAAMGGDLTVSQLAENVLGFLAVYLDAQAGAFFSKDGPDYRLAATYGVPARAEIPQTVVAGDGLLGQSVKDRRSILVHSVPDGYLSAGSALGLSKPRDLLIVPVSADGAPNAVLELGFFREANELAGELLERVSESIGVAVKSANYRTHLQKLLEETQSQAEELQAQGEELRVANEELEEQGRALKDSHARLELQQAELEQTNAQLEEQAQLLESQRDNLARANSSLEMQARELDQASRYKSDFLANMSHELRTPLNSSLILAKLLADNAQGNLTADQVKYAQTILSSGNDLLALINDILDLSKIEAGRMEVRPEPVALARIFEDLSRTFELLAAQKGLELRTFVSPGCPDEIESDRQRLEQILKNLLSNAIKFTNKGHVALGAGLTTDGRLALTVSDTGIGIGEDQQRIVFEAFRQADGTTNRKYGGTGLGLSISRELARLLGGEIRLTSEPGRGSTFTVVLPVAYDPAQVRPRSSDAERRVVPELVNPATPVPSSRHMEPAVATPPLAHRSAEDDRERLTGDSRVLLIVEDDDSFARILYDLAHELNFQCLIAGTAEEAIAIAVQFRPSAVVLDVGLPDHSGLSVLDRLKRDTRTRHIPVHVVSCNDYSHTALTLGAVGYMLKPVKREELAEALKNLESRLAQRLRRVLVVEDDPVQLNSLRELLGTQAVETVGVSTARECLGRLKGETFDCMVLDLSLPDTSGYSLLETLSREDAYSFPPVIVYTGRDLSAEDEQRLRRYSKSIIIKGAKSPERLLDEVTLFLHQVVSDLPQEQQRMLERAKRRDATLEGRRILVVEDDVRNVFALSSALEPHGAVIEIARNGREAIDAIEATSGAADRAIDLVLMDVMMPEMDGITATREIRKRAEWRNLPILMLTAKAMSDDQARCLEAGANDYMAKPLDVEKLLSLVRVWMPR